MKYISKIFQPLIVTPRNVTAKPKEITSKSQRLMIEFGVVRPTNNHGLFSLLPLGMRSLDKLTSLVQSKLKSLNALQITLPTLISEDLWMRSGRIKVAGPEIMRMKDRHDKRFILGPTHEESITDLIASVSPLSPKQLPLRLYQITNKFRDEMRPRYGVIRAREFLMKDLYSFDADQELAKKTYDAVSDVYEQIFNAIGVDYIKVEGSTGDIGGSVSHEYHYPAQIGEDCLIECNSCGTRVSQEHLKVLTNTENENELSCSKCGNQDLKRTLGLEVGHTFLLGTKYSAPLSAFTIGSTPLYMGCYGLGLTRLIGAALESLSTDTELRWPVSLVPYTICLIGPKKGSKEEKASPLVEELYSLLTSSFSILRDDVVIDDRSYLTIGKRVVEAKRFGYPYIIIIGQKACQEVPKFELLDINTGSIQLLEKSTLLEKVRDVVKSLKTPSSPNYMESYSVSSDILTENSLK